MYLTVFVGTALPFTVNLEEFQKERVTFGRAQDNDMLLPSPIASSYHGSFFKDRDVWKVRDEHSTNGLYVNEEAISERILSDGLKLYIGSERHNERVVMICSTVNQDAMYQHVSLIGKDHLRIGKSKGCDICLEHVGISQVHAELIRGKDGWSIQPVGKSEIRLNGELLASGGQKLSHMNRFLIGNTQFLYRGDELVYYVCKKGLGLEVSHLSKEVSFNKTKKTIVDDVSFQLLPGEFAAIVGGSGAGKSSLMKCINGASGFTKGSVLLQGEDIRSGYEGLKKLIGYVPQQDIVYDNLTLERMLYYSAKLRMPQDCVVEDIKKRIGEVLEIVELSGMEQVMIHNLSGGQKKRASIAVELLSDPGIFFLDEPTSGLDPGTEQSLMHTLKQMTQQDKTVILVTHTPLNLALCDKIIVMGPGGRLCFCGSPSEALRFFRVENLVDIYNLIRADTEVWVERFTGQQMLSPMPLEKSEKPKEKKKVSAFYQWRILSNRYVEMIWNDKRKLLLQILMAPVLGAMLYLAFSSSLEPFAYWTDTQTFSIAMACCFFWMGMFQSIQEISKERVIIEREKMADLKAGACLSSKVAVLGVMLLFQCVLLMGVVWIFIGHPEEGMILKKAPFIEYLITAYLTAVSASALGLGVSAAVNSTDQAVAAAPFLLIPQILFSQVICSVNGAAEILTWFVSCNWSCLAFCTSANINALYNKGKEGIFGEFELVEMSKVRYACNAPFFSWDNPVTKSWAAMLGLTVFFLAIALLALRKKREI